MHYKYGRIGGGVEIIAVVNKCLTDVGVLSVKHLLAGVFAE